jgi:Flp pilus assembly protein TadG
MRVCRNKRYAVQPRGVALTELALILPLMFVLFLGILDFGRVFYSALAISHSARAGVQYGAQDNAKSGDFAGMRQRALSAATDVSDVRVNSCRYCRCADGTGSCTSCSADTDGCSSGSNCLSGCRSDAPQVYVQVTVDKVFTTLFPYPGIPSRAELTRRAIMRVQ